MSLLFAPDTSDTDAMNTIRPGVLRPRSRSCTVCRHASTPRPSSRVRYLHGAPLAFRTPCRWSAGRGRLPSPWARMDWLNYSHSHPHPGATTYRHIVTAQIVVAHHPRVHAALLLVSRHVGSSRPKEGLP